MCRWVLVLDKKKKDFIKVGAACIGVWATSLLTQERQERRRGPVKNIKLALFLDMFTHYFEILNIIFLSLCIRVMKDQTL
jgi:hypothetical protein